MVVTFAPRRRTEPYSAAVAVRSTDRTVERPVRLSRGQPTRTPEAG